MDIPSVVASALGEETVSDRVSLKGEDALYVTPTRTIHYESEGFLSDESVEEYPHDAERVSVDTGRRKATLSLDYGTDGTRSFSIPKAAVSDAIHAVLGGVLRARSVIDPEETLRATYRFGELTLAVTSRRVIKHVGTAVWDEEYVSVPFESVRGLETEEGNVASQLVVSTPDRSERIKTPSEAFREVDETVREALFAYHDVPDQAAFEELVSPDGDAEDRDENTGAGGETRDETGAEGEEPEYSAASESSESESVEPVRFVAATEPDPDELLAELDELEAALDEQAALIEDQLAAIDEQRTRIESLRESIGE
ncbi:MAG: hypothetical protein ABEJ60_03350 [Halodesulfurarchaeum sp.]